jgi:hypothetical protein
MHRVVPRMCGQDSPLIVKRRSGEVAPSAPFLALRRTGAELSNSWRRPTTSNGNAVTDGGRVEGNGAGFGHVDAIMSRSVGRNEDEQFHAFGAHFA